MISWHDKTVRVQAKLVPRFFWTTASIDVYLADQCILRSGGSLKFTGSCSATFSCDGSSHRVDLRYGLAAFRHIPYKLEIDGLAVDDSKVYVQHWPVGFAIGLFIGAMIVEIIYRLFP